MRRGDLVQCWFDTGAMSATILYGHAVASSPCAFTVEWESGIRNRWPQSGYDHQVKIAEDHESARHALRRLLSKGTS